MADKFTERYLALHSNGLKTRDEEEEKKSSSSGSEAKKSTSNTNGAGDFTSRYLSLRDPGKQASNERTFSPIMPDLRRANTSSEDREATVTQTPTSYLETARNATKNTLYTPSDLDDEEKEKRKAELENEISTLKNSIQQRSAGLSRARLYGNANILEENIAADQKRLDEMEDELKALERTGSHSYKDQLDWQLSDAKENVKDLQSVLPVGQAATRSLGTRMMNDPEYANEYREQVKSYTDASRELKDLEREEDMIDYLVKNMDKTYNDTFTGQFGANYSIGRMNQDSSLAWNKYLNTGDEADRAYAEAIDELIKQFQENNAETLADDGTLPWISKSLANYVPQLTDQLKYSAVGGATGGLGGSVIPGIGTALGIKAGIVSGSGLYSYNTMRGAAFSGLLDLGIDEETARKAANDEAVVSSLIEMADTGWDIATFGVGKLINTVVKGGAKAVGNKAAQSAAKKLLKGLAKYGLNIAGEAGQEYLQEGISIANEKRALGSKGMTNEEYQSLVNEWGKPIADNIRDKRLETTMDDSLVKTASGIVKDDITGDSSPEQSQRMRAAAIEGAKIAAMMGGASMVTTSATNSLITNAQARRALQQNNNAIADVTPQNRETNTETVEAGNNQTIDGTTSTESGKENVAAQEPKNKQAQENTASKTSFDYVAKAQKVRDNGIFTGEYASAFEKSGLSYTEIDNAIESILKGKIDATDQTTSKVMSILDGSEWKSAQENARTVDAKSATEVEAAGFDTEDTLEQTAREAVTEKENTVSEAASKPTTAERPSYYNVLNQNAKTAQRTTSSDTKPGYGEYGTQEFNKLVEDLNVSPDQVRSRFQSAYEAGLSNVPTDRVNLQTHVQQVAFNAGKRDYIMSMKRSTEKSKYATVYGKESGFIQTDAAKGVDVNVVDTLNTVSKALGIKAQFAESVYGGKANGSMSNNGILTIAKDASNPYMVVAKHEITHRMQQLAPAQYTEYRNYAVQTLSNSNGQTTLSLVEEYQNQAANSGVTLTTEQAMDEIAADFTENILTDENSLRDFVNDAVQKKDTRTAAQKFFQAVREFIDKVKRIFKGDKAKMDKAAQEQFGATVSQLEKAEQLWKEAYRASEKNAQELSQKAQKNTDQADGVQYSLNPDFEKQFDTWLANKSGNAGVGSFLVGTTSDALKSIGVSDYKIYWRKAKLAKIMKDHPAMTADVIKSVPNVLENPVLVMQSQTVANRITLFGEAMDADGKPVLVAVELRPQNKSGEVMDFAVIASTYGKNGAQKIIDTSDILYVDPNKKRTDNWLGLLRLQLPSSLTKYGSIDMVTYVNRDVNGVITAGDTGGKTAMQEAFEKAMLSDTDVQYSLRKKDPPKKTGIAYKVFLAKDGQLYPPMVANPGGAGTPVGVWLDADAAPLAGTSKTGRLQVAAGGKGTNVGKTQLAYRPGWHLGDVPQAKQFAKLNPETGVKELFPSNFVWAECEYAMDVDYQEEAMSYGYTENGKFRHSYAGLPKLPEDGYYRYRTNPNPDTVPWVITGAMKVKRILTDAETDAILRENGVEPMKRQGGPIDLEKFGLKAGDTDEQYTQQTTDTTNQTAPGEDTGAKDNTHEQFSLKKPVEETDRLIALHNLTADKLKKVLKLGGFPMPSIAVTRTDIPHTNFGDITLVMNKSSIDPQANRKNTVYSADAWTPTVPSIEYDADQAVGSRISEKLDGLKARIDELFRDDLYRVSYDFSDMLNRYGGEAELIQAVMDNYGLKAAYLEDIGHSVERVTKQEEVSKGYSEDRTDKYEAIIDILGTDDADAIGKIHLGELKAQHGDALENVLPGMTKSSLRMSGILRQVQAYIRGKNSTTEYKTVADLSATRQAIDKAINRGAYEQWVKKLFSGIEGKRGIYNNKDYFTPSGNRRSFDQLHLPVTLENIVKAMASQNDGNTKNVAGFNGVKTLRAGMAKRFKSIADMHKLEGRLQNLTEEEFGAIHDALSDRMFDIINRIIETGARSSENSFSRMDSVGSIMMDIADGGKYTVDSIVKVFTQYRYKIGNQLAMDIRDLLFDISQMPTNLFEAKPERAVGFNEVLAAVVPDDTDQKIIDDLNTAGVGNVMTYAKGDDAARLELVNSVDGAQFSLKGQDDLMKKYEKLREVNETLKSQLKTTTFAKVDKKSLDAFTKKLLKDYSSGADINETRAALDDLYGYIANGEDGNAPAWNEVYKRAYEASVDILEGASVVMDDDYRQYKELRDTIRTTGLTISDQDKPDLHNGYQAFRKANMGRIKLVNDGLPVDSFYQELASAYPEFFDEYAHTHPADQLENIADVLDSLQPYEVNPYSHNMRESATWLANDIIERFYELPQAKPTFADKANRKLTEQVIKDTKKLEKLREQKNARISDIIAKNREKVKEVTTKERTKRTEAVQKVKEHYTEKEARASDRRKISIFKSKINKHVANISKMLLKPTETSHVPESLRGTVSGFLSVLDLTTDKQQEKTLNRLNDLRNQYQKIADGKHDVVMEVDPDLIDNIDAVISALGNDGTISIADLKARDLESLYRVTLAVERSIYSYNRAMTEGMNATISELGQSAMIENSAGKGYQESSVRPKQWAADLLNMDMLNPQDFFMQMGGTMESLYHSIRKGFDQKIRNTAIAQDYMKDLVKDVDLKKISGEKARTQEFKTANGSTISLTPAQVMSLYLLQKQPEALDHIYVGGIKQAPTVALKGKDRRPSITRSYDVVKVTPDDVAKILGSLTPEQRKIADGIGEFFTKYTAEWGNEVSLALYGYKKFTVENYFPIVSDRNYIADVFGETQDSTLKNMGSTKSRQKGANNPVIIEDVFDVYTRQADQMSSYNAFVIPLSDMQRVFNYKTMDGSVKQSIEKRFGTRATRYFKQLMTDINGGAHYNGGSPIMNDLISKYKQAKLGLNLRVIVQQPTAYLRAAAMIDPKYIAAAIPIRNTAKTETIYKYAPIAQWKDWGYFSMDTGKRMRSLIMGEKELSDYTMWAAGKMDEITWKTLWTATELEIRDKQPELKRGSEEYYEAIGERFSEVIDRTQVVDSTLHRSQALRNPDTAYKMAVSFMSEPIKAYNLLRSAVVEAKNNPSAAAKKALGAAVGGYVASIVVNHLVTALVDTMRGEDDDEPWLEEVVNKIIGKDDEENKEHTWQHRYIWNFVDNLVNEPLSMIPFAKDITSLVQGFDIKRMDSQGISDFLNAGKRALSDKYTIGFKIADMSSKAADLFGIPASNVRRELSTMTKYLIGAMDSPWMEYQNEKLWNNIGSSKNRGKFLDILYKAYEAGDTDAYNRIVEDLMDNGIAASSIESGMRSRAKKAGVDVDSINSLTTGIGIKPKYDVGESEEEESYTVDNLTGAQYTQYIEDRGDMVDQIIRDFNNNGFGSLDAETANELLSAAYKYAEETALEDASGGAYESDTKWIDKAQNADALGLTTSEYIMLMNEYGASSIGADGVYEAYDAGIDVETYLEFKAATSDMTADKDSEGNSIPGTKKEKVMDYMDTMGLTQDEYDALLEIAGYKSDDEQKSGFGSSSFGSSSFGSSSFGKSSFGKSSFGSK